MQLVGGKGVFQQIVDDSGAAADRSTPAAVAVLVGSPPTPPARVPSPDFSLAGRFLAPGVDAEARQRAAADAAVNAAVQGAHEIFGNLPEDVICAGINIITHSVTNIFQRTLAVVEPDFQPNKLENSRVTASMAGRILAEIFRNTYDAAIVQVPLLPQDVVLAAALNSVEVGSMAFFATYELLHSGLGHQSSAEIACEIARATEDYATKAFLFTSTNLFNDLSCTSDEAKRAAGNVGSLIGFATESSFSYLAQFNGDGFPFRDPQSAKEILLEATRSTGDKLGSSLGSIFEHDFDQLGDVRESLAAAIRAAKTISTTVETTFLLIYQAGMTQGSCAHDVAAEAARIAASMLASVTNDAFKNAFDTVRPEYSRFDHLETAFTAIKAIDHAVKHGVFPLIPTIFRSITIGGDVRRTVDGLTGAVANNVSVVFLDLFRKFHPGHGHGAATEYANKALEACRPCIDLAADVTMNFLPQLRAPLMQSDVLTAAIQSFTETATLCQSIYFSTFSAVSADPSCDPATAATEFTEISGLAIQHAMQRAYAVYAPLYSSNALDTTIRVAQVIGEICQLSFSKSYPAAAAKFHNHRRAFEIATEATKIATEAAINIFVSSCAAHNGEQLDDTTTLLALALGAAESTGRAVAEIYELNYQLVAEPEEAAVWARQSAGSFIEICPSIFELADTLGPECHINARNFARITIDIFKRTFFEAMTRLQGPAHYLIAKDAARCAARAAAGVCRLAYAGAKKHDENTQEETLISAAAACATSAADVTRDSFIRAYQENIADPTMRLRRALGIAQATGRSFSSSFAAAVSYQENATAICTAIMIAHDVERPVKKAYARIIGLEAELGAGAMDVETICIITDLASQTYCLASAQALANKKPPDYAFCAADKAATDTVAAVLKTLKRHFRSLQGQAAAQRTSTPSLALSISKVYTLTFQRLLSKYGQDMAQAFALACVTSQSFSELANLLKTLNQDTDQKALDGAAECAAEAIDSIYSRGINDEAATWASTGPQLCAAAGILSLEVYSKVFLKLKGHLKPANTTPFRQAAQSAASEALDTFSDNYAEIITIVQDDRALAVEIARALSPFISATIEEYLDRKAVQVNDEASLATYTSQLTAQALSATVFAEALSKKAIDLLKETFVEVQRAHGQQAAYLAITVVARTICAAFRLSSDVMIVANISDLERFFLSMVKNAAIIIPDVFNNIYSFSAQGQNATEAASSASANREQVASSFAVSSIWPLYIEVFKEDLRLGYDADPTELATFVSSLCSICLGIFYYRHTFLTRDSAANIVKGLGSIANLSAVKIYRNLIPNLRHIYTIQIIKRAGEEIFKGLFPVLDLLLGQAHHAQTPYATPIMVASALAEMSTATFGNIFSAAIPYGGRKWAVTPAIAAVNSVMSRFSQTFLQAFSSLGVHGALALAQHAAQAVAQEELRRYPALPADPPVAEQDVIFRRLAAQVQAGSAINLSEVLNPLSMHLAATLPPLLPTHNLAQDNVWKSFGTLLKNIIAEVPQPSAFPRRRGELLVSIVHGEYITDEEGRRVHARSWLEKILESKDAESLRGMRIVQERAARCILGIIELFQAKQVKVVSKILDNLYDHSHGCPDRAVIGLAKLEMEVLAGLALLHASNPDAKAHVLADLLIHRYKIHIIEQLAGIANPGSESAETGSFLSVRYNRVLSLDLNNRDLLFAYIARRGVGTYEEDLDRILRSMAEMDNLLGFFLESDDAELWKRTLFARELFDETDEASIDAYSARVKTELAISATDVRASLAAAQHVEISAIPELDVTIEIDRLVEQEVFRRRADTESRFPELTRRLLTARGYLISPQRPEQHDGGAISQAASTPHQDVPTA